MTQDSVWQGYPPDVTIGEGNPEALKYGKMWERDEYRLVAPGEDLVDLFLDKAAPRAGAEIIDFGCGTGRGGAALLQRGKLRVTLVDFVNNCLDQKVRDLIAARPDEIHFVKADLERPLPVVAEYGYCCDVMEHIPEIRVLTVLKSVLLAAQHVFFSISATEDNCGELVGERLHMTVQGYGWWLKQFSALDCVIHWSQDLGTACLFYVSAWSNAQAVVDIGIVNVSDEQIRANVRANVAGLKWAQVTPHATNDLEAMILGGGPSLTDFEAEIKQKRADGVKLITLGGAYNWALDHGLIPSATVVVDARPFNARFVKPVVKDCLYMICSQVDPSVFEGLPEDQTYIWHTTAEDHKAIVMAEYPVYWPIPGGSTTLLRAIPMFRTLGYHRFHLYGCDSCVQMADALSVPEGLSVSGQAALKTPGRDPWGTHHAYPQPENNERVYPVTCGGRTFWCQTWMISQAQEFINLIRNIGDEIELEVHGDGLLAHILATGARLEDERTEQLAKTEV